MTRAQVRSIENASADSFQSNLHGMRATFEHHYGDDGLLDSILVDCTRFRLPADSLTARAARADFAMLVDSLKPAFGLPNSLVEVYRQSGPCSGSDGSINERVAMGCTVLGGLWSGYDSVVIATVDGASGTVTHTIVVRPPYRPSSVELETLPSVMSLD